MGAVEDGDLIRGGVNLVKEFLFIAYGPDIESLSSEEKLERLTRILFIANQYNLLLIVYRRKY